MNRGKENQVDENLLAQIAKGDDEAFCTLYRATDRAVYGYALSILKNEFDAQDVMQEVYLKIKTCTHQYKPAGKPMAWIFTIVKHTCFMKLREKGRDFVPLEDCPLQVSIDKISNREDQIVLESALEQLKIEERQIVMLHTVSGLKHREIAEVMDLPLGTVLSKYKRSLEKLKQYLGGEEDAS